MSKAETSPQLPEEYPLQILARSQELATLICSPDYLAELALGWALAQGIEVTAETEVQIVRTETGASASLNVDVPAALPWKRYVVSGFDAGMLLGHEGQPVDGDAGMAGDDFEARIGEVFEQFRAKRRAGGFHHAAFVNQDDVRLVIADISRHNAIDKAVGWALRNREPAQQAALVLSGRISSDIVLKAARYGVPIIATRSLPTRQAVNLAEDLQVMLVCRAVDRRRVHFGADRLR